jgi:hypothetical protein
LVLGVDTHWLILEGERIGSDLVVLGANLAIAVVLNRVWDEARMKIDVALISSKNLEGTNLVVSDERDRARSMNEAVASVVLQGRLGIEGADKGEDITSREAKILGNAVLVGNLKVGGAWVAARHTGRLA